VSVIIPTRDRRGLLEQALESVEAQTYNPIEVVVVDGSTRPVSRAFVEEAVGQDTTVVCRRGPRRGAAAARNAGIRFAEGDYLSFLDDDDRWLPSKVMRQIDQFESEGSRIGVVYTGQRSVDAKGRTIAVSSPSTRGDVTEALLRGARMTPLSGVMVRRSIVDAAGLFDERLPVWEDLDWYIRLSTHGDVESIADLLTIRRMAEHDQLTDRFETIRDVAYPRFVAKNRPLAAEYGPNCERAMVAARLLDVAHAGLENDEFASGVSLLVQALLRSPRSWEIYPYLLAAVGGPATFRSARWLHRRAQRLTAVWSSSLS
jgi:glycosyltransferase involved in cell wall biosynthesis